MFERIDSLNYTSDKEAPEATLELEQRGHAVLRGVLAPDEVEELRKEILEVYATAPPDMRDSATTRELGEMYRYRMFHHSPLCQQAIGKREILDVIEPLLGQDCHLISCTSWNNPPGESNTPHGLQWHIDGGPYVPRPINTPWPAHVPYPVFIIAAHIYMSDVDVDDGPTTCISGSNQSGQMPPFDRLLDDQLSYTGNLSSQDSVKAGDVGLRVSDVWHRRSPPTDASRGRLFIQTNYGRRDIAQRLLPTEDCHQASSESLARAHSDRERRLLGVHPQAYFDA